jgi:hypothetical protein
MSDRSTTPDDIRNRLIAKAWEDDAFKKALVENPKATIEKELEVTLPADLNIRVFEETRDTICLVLPVNPDDLPEAQISEEELDAVAGGALASGELGLASRFDGFGRLRTLTYTIPSTRRQ